MVVPTGNSRKKGPGAVCSCPRSVLSAKPMCGDREIPVDTWPAAQTQRCSELGTPRGTLGVRGASRQLGSPLPTADWGGWSCS